MMDRPETRLYGAEFQDRSNRLPTFERVARAAPPKRGEQKLYGSDFQQREK